MTRSAIFTAAHKLTRETMQAGDSYRVTFGACLRAILRGETRPALRLGLVGRAEVQRAIDAGYSHDDIRAAVAAKGMSTRRADELILECTDERARRAADYDAKRYDARRASRDARKRVTRPAQPVRRPARIADSYVEECVEELMEAGYSRAAAMREMNR